MDVQLMLGVAAVWTAAGLLNFFVLSVLGFASLFGTKFLEAVIVSLAAGPIAAHVLYAGDFTYAIGVTVGFFISLMLARTLRAIATFFLRKKTTSAETKGK